jgi:hypothetical protein
MNLLRLILLDLTDGRVHEKIESFYFADICNSIIVDSGCVIGKRSKVLTSSIFVM